MMICSLVAWEQYQTQPKLILSIFKRSLLEFFSWRKTGSWLESFFRAIWCSNWFESSQIILTKFTRPLYKIVRFNLPTSFGKIFRKNAWPLPESFCTDFYLQFLKWMSSKNSFEISVNQNQRYTKSYSIQNSTQWLLFRENSHRL